MTAFLVALLVVAGIGLIKGYGWYSRRLGTHEARRSDRRTGYAMFACAAILAVASLIR